MVQIQSRRGSPNPERGRLLQMRTFLACFTFLLVSLQVSLWTAIGNSDDSSKHRVLQEIAGCSSVLPQENPRGRDRTKKTEKPCALLFFGLAKQFRSIVLPSIQEYILNTGDNRRCDIYIHNYNVTKSVNPRAGEHDNVIDPMEVYDLTRPSNVVIETIDDFLRQRDMKFYAHSDLKPYRSLGWDRTAFENMYKQWHSIEKVWDLMKAAEAHQGIEYDRIGFFRSDVKYVTPIDIFDGDAVIPKFGFLVNDRMFYGTYENARIWAKIRFPSVKCYRPRHKSIKMHSEFFMNDLVLQNIPGVTKKDICFYRVRADGDVWEE